MLGTPKKSGVLRGETVIGIKNDLSKMWSKDIMQLVAIMVKY